MRAEKLCGYLLNQREAVREAVRGTAAEGARNSGMWDTVTKGASSYAEPDGNGAVGDEDAESESDWGSTDDDNYMSERVGASVRQRGAGRRLRRMTNMQSSETSSKMQG